MKIRLFVYFVFLTVLLVFTASAGFSDWIKTINGYATEQSTNVSVSVTGSNAVVVTIINSTLTGTVVDPTESSFTNINFTVQVYDADGVSDINDTVVNANFTKSNEANRIDTNCPWHSDINSTTANYSCSINMWYFDAPGTWTITASGNDIGNMTAQVDTKTFSYDSLTSMVLSPSSISWTSVSPGQTNQTASNHPTLINNTGNYNITNVTFIGINLLGETTPSSYIGVGNISVDIDTGASAECAGGTALANATEKQVTNALLSRGNYSLNYQNATSGQEQLYYCMTTVPLNIPSQTYSTTGGGAWTIKVVQ